MQPDHPAPNYDFIMNHDTAPKKAPLGGNSMATRILVVVVGVFLLAIIAGVAIKLLSGGSGGGFNQAAALSVAQDQTEIIRLSQTGVQNSVSQTNKNFSATTALTMRSEQAALLEFLATAGYEPDPKALLLKQSAETDSQLTAALSSSTFDEVYKDVMQKALEAYRSDLTAAYTDASQAAQAEFSARYEAAGLLLAQLTGQSTTD